MKNIAIVGLGKWGKNLLREFSGICNIVACHSIGNKENKLVVFSKNAKKLAYEKFLFEGKVKKYEEMFRYAIENKIA